MMFFFRLAAFIRKNFLVNVSYRLFFVLNLLGAVASVLTFYFIAKMLGRGISPYLKEYHGEYFPYVLLGLAFYNYLSLSLKTFSVSLREEQVTGTLEAVFLAPLKIPVLIICLPCWDFIFNSLNAFFCLLFGIYFLGARFIAPNLPAVFLIISLTIISSFAVGIISAAFIMVFKRGDPVVWIISLVSGIFGGVYFPVSVLPEKLRFISHLLPITYSLEALRNAMIKGYGLRELLPAIAVLAMFCLVLLPSSILIFWFAVKKTKASGSLVYY